MNKTYILSLFIIFIFMAATIQASESSDSANESTPLVTFNECLNTATTYTSHTNAIPLKNKKPFTIQ